MQKQQEDIIEFLEGVKKIFIAICKNIPQYDNIHHNTTKIISIKKGENDMYNLMFSDCDNVFKIECSKEYYTIIRLWSLHDVELTPARLYKALGIASRYYAKINNNNVNLEIRLGAIESVLWKLLVPKDDYKGLLKNEWGDEH